LNLETIPHHKPYPLGWITRDTSLQVTRKCLFKFAITANFVDEVELDVVPLDISSVVLGSPYLYDRKAVFYCHENKYHLFKDGVEYIVRVHHKKLNISLVNAEQAKRLMNSSKSLVLLMFKPNDDIVYENVVSCNASFNSNLVGSVHQSDEVFQVVKESSFKEKETSHEISLQQEVSLCDVSMQGLTKLQSVETPMQCKSLLNNGLIQSALTPCYALMVMVPKRNGNYFKKEDKRSSFRQSKVVERGQCKNIHNTKQEWFVCRLMFYVLCSTSTTYMYLNYGKNVLKKLSTWVT